MECINSCDQTLQAFILIFSYPVIIAIIGFTVEYILGGFKND